MNIIRQPFVLALLLTPLLAVPSTAAGSGYISVSVGTGGGVSGFGATDWAIYGSSWQDTGWGISFEHHLDGYGEWVAVDGIGRVWRPWVASGWRPYTYGRWVWTEVGWTWIAYEPWGYFPHHYGNWAMTTFGWVWVPGWTYRPATVSWVSCGTYVGWYPTPPPGWVHTYRAFNRGWIDGYRSGYGDGYREGWRDARYATWVPWGHLGDDDLSRRAVDYHNISRNPNAATTRVISAPDRGEVVRRGATIPTTTLEQRAVSAGERRITVARPKGFTETVRSHGEDAARRALSTRVNRPTHGQDGLRSKPAGPDAAETATRPRGGTQLSSSNARAIRTSGQQADSNRLVRSGATRNNANDPAPRRGVVYEKRDSIGDPEIDRRPESRELQPRSPGHTGRAVRQPARGSSGRAAGGSQGDRSAARLPPSGSRDGIIDPRSVDRSRQQQPPRSRDSEGTPSTERSAARSRSTAIPGSAVIHPGSRDSEPRPDQKPTPRSQDDRQRRRSGSAAKPK